MARNHKSGGHPQGDAVWFGLLVLLVIAVAGFVRFWDLFDLPLTNDETSALMRLDVGSVSELLSTVVWNDGHPMLVQVFLWFWTKWFGTSVWVVKLPFLMCGVGSVMLMVHIGMRLGAGWAGLLAAAMLATLQFPVMYSEIARPYAPGLLLALWAFYVWLRWLEVCRWEAVGIKEAYKPLILLAISGYLGASNHYFNGLILALLLVSGLVILPRNRWMRYLWPWWLMAALYVHQLGIFWHHLQVGSPGWLQAPTWKTLVKHVMYSVGYSFWPVLLWLGFVGYAVITKKWTLSGGAADGEVAIGEEAGEGASHRMNKQVFVVWGLYLLPLLIAFVYSVYRAPVFQDSVLLFSFGFGLLGFAMWVDRKVLSIKLKSGLVILTLVVNLYVLFVDRNHRELFNNQSYDAAVKSLKRWAVLDEVSDGDAMWVYGFESFFMEYHAQELGWDVNAWRKKGGKLRYYREETSDYQVFRKKLGGVEGDDLYFLNMVGMDPMLRVWIQRVFPVLRRESMGAGYHVMHFSKDKGTSRIVPLLSHRNVLKGDIDSSQYREVLALPLDTLGEDRFDAEFVARAYLELDTSLLRRKDVRLVLTISNREGETVRFLDRGLGDMGYEIKEVRHLAGGLCAVELVLAGRLVDVEWGGGGLGGLKGLVNHSLGGGYRMQIFIDNLGRNSVALRGLGVDFWKGNASVYGLVNPAIP